MEKCPGDIIILHMCTKNHNHDVWFLRYRVRQTEFFVILGHYLPFNPTPLLILKIKILKKKMEKMPQDIVLLCINVYHKWRSYDIWFLIYKVQQTESFIILGHFLPFSPLTTQKIKILKLKKTPGDIIILHISTINDNHMMYDSWNMECDRQNFLSFWTVFCPFTSL